MKDETSEIRRVIVVFGGRHYPYRYAVWNQLLNIMEGVSPEQVMIRHGACRTGTDNHARAFCASWKSSGLIEDPVPADWDDISAPGAVIRRHGNGSLFNARAGIDRNGLMLEREPKPTHALGTPGGTGTADMRRRIERACADGVDIKLTMLGG
jgi:hypothetical protein